MPRSDPPDLLVTFGAVVREARHRLGVSQEELAGRAGVHRTYLGGIEQGKRNLALRNIDRLARALETDMGTLLGEVEAARQR